MTAPALTRFFFHVVGGARGLQGRGFQDDEGEVFATSMAAQNHADRIAHDLRNDAYRGCEIRITDAAGTEVARVPIGGADRN
jgi:hypothetical protein